MDETINTLKFADRARQVMVKVRKNEVSATNDDLVQNLQREIQYLKDMLQIKKNGGISELHNQLIALKEENHQLKKQLNVQLSVEEVERLRKENKKLRLELQSVSTKENTQYESSLFVTEVSSQDEKRNVKESIASERTGKNSVKNSIPSAKDVEDYMRNGTNLQQILDLLRKKDLDTAADGIKNKILSEGRCPVCTLKPPCKHYESSDTIPKTESKPPRPIFNNIENNKLISLDSTPIGIVRVPSKYTSDTRNSPESIPQSQGSQISSSSVPPIFRQDNRAFEPMNNIRNTYYIPRQSTQSNRSPGMRQPLFASNGVNKSFELPAKLSVRYRNKSNTYQTSGGRVEEMQRSQERKVELRKAEERLENLAKIEAYREERLRREIEKLEEEKRKEDEEERQKQLKEAKRRKYLEEQKRKLDTYYEDRKKQEEDVKKQQESEKAKLLKEAKKKQKEVSQKKQQIMEYHKKKVLIDGIITEQMEDLSNLYVENDIIRRSTSLNMKK
jgi:hypothetical protein